MHREFHSKRHDMEATISWLAENLSSSLLCDEQYIALAGLLGPDNVLLWRRGTPRARY